MATNVGALCVIYGVVLLILFVYAIQVACSVINNIFQD